MYPSESDVNTFFDDLSSDFDLHINQLDNANEYVLSKDNKDIIFKWSPTAPEEFWFVFSSENKYLYEDWTEMFETEEKEALFSYLKLISMRYFEHATRLHKPWLIFKARVQYKIQGKWKDILSPI
ncbi:MAG: hypothetical protein OEZ31_11660 [Nitrospirota bacterium]|nr:hypothetical protein [Nitrospirota bacterium]